MVLQKSSVGCINTTRCRKFSKFCLFRAGQKILTRFYNDGQWENLWQHINKYQGVKEFHMLARIGCCNIMVFSPFKVKVTYYHPLNQWLLATHWPYAGRGGVLPSGGGVLPPCEQNDRQVQKYYLGHNFVAAGNNWLKNNTAQLYFILGMPMLEFFHPTLWWLWYSQIYQQPCALLEICEYQSHPKVNRENSNIARLYLI